MKSGIKVSPKNLSWDKVRTDSKESSTKKDLRGLG